MTSRMPTSDASRPRWDGRNILFEVIEGNHSVACAISPQALEALSGRRRFKPADLLGSFVAARARIETIALTKLGRRPPELSGMLHIWSDDIDDLPLASAPV